MAIHFETDDASGLLDRIKAAIDDGTVETWSYDDDGDFTHTPDEWDSEAWLRPDVSENRLSFFILPPRGERISKDVYGVYHGRFVEMVVTHFDDAFETAAVSAMPEDDDLVHSET